MDSFKVIKQFIYQFLLDNILEIKMPEGLRWNKNYIKIKFSFQTLVKLIFQGISKHS